jgi:hypothetical protein
MLAQEVLGLPFAKADSEVDPAPLKAYQRPFTLKLKSERADSEVEHKQRCSTGVR